MKKIYKFVLGVMKAFLALVVLACLGILLYAGFAPEDDKKSLSKSHEESAQVMDEPETENVVIEMSAEKEEPIVLKTDEETGGRIQEQEEIKEIEFTKELSSNILADMQKQVEMEDSIREVYLQALQYLSLESYNLTYDGVIDAYNQTCPAFSVIDNQGNKQLPQLVFYKPGQSLYYYDPQNDMGEPTMVQSGDYDWIHAGREAELLAYNNISTDNPGGNTWEEVLNGYLNALLYERDLQKVVTYVDTSRLLEPDVEHAQAYNAMKTTQRHIVSWLVNGNKREKRKESGEIWEYNLTYQIGESNIGTDETGEVYRQVRVYYTVTIDAEWGSDQETTSDIIVFKMYPDGWKVIMHKP